MATPTQTRKVLPVTEEVLEAALVGYYQCLVCLRIFNEESKCRCSREDRQEKMNSFIALHYGAERLPPPIRRLMYPDYVPPSLPPAQATSPPPPSSEVLVPPSPQYEELSTSDFNRGQAPLQSNVEDSSHAPSTSEAFTRRPNASSGGSPIASINTFTVPTTSTRLSTSSVSPSSLSERSRPPAETQVPPKVPRAELLILPKSEPTNFEEVSSHLDEPVEPTVLNRDSASPPQNRNDVSDEETATPEATITQIRIRTLRSAKGAPPIKNRIASASHLPVSPHSAELPSKTGRSRSSSKTTRDSTLNPKHRPPTSSFVRPRYNLKRNEPGHTCLFCGKVFSRGYHLNDHIRRHIQETPFECPHCGTGFSAQISWRYHTKYTCHVRPRERRFSCPLCPRKFHSKSNMTAHRATHLESSKRPIFRCSSCPATYKSIQGLRFHTRAKHDQTKHECRQCGKLFSHVRTLRKHGLQCHQKIKAHSCLFCEKAFVTNQDLFRHLRHHTREKPYPCLECEEFFTHSNHLSYHLRITHSSKEGKDEDLSCVFCGKQFAHRDRLDAHLCGHIQEKWFSCRICGAEFTSERTQLVHGRNFHRK